MIKQIATVAVYVRDQKEALEFWTKKVGFNLRDNIDMGNGMSWMEVAPEGAETRLVLYPQKLMSDFAERKASIVFACENIEAYCAELKSNGVTFTEELSQMAWGKFASFRDEDGNEFGLKET